jgi:hypothetical protein
MQEAVGKSKLTGEPILHKEKVWEKGWDERRAREQAANAIGREKLQSKFPNWVFSGEMSPERGKAEYEAAQAAKGAEKPAPKQKGVGGNALKIIQDEKARRGGKK